jgi:hypothetical protein
MESDDAILALAVNSHSGAGRDRDAPLAVQSLWHEKKVC